MISSAEILSRLDKVKSIGRNKWQACCPCHADKEPSLTLTLTDKWLIKCHAGCDTQDILDRIGIDTKELFPCSYQQSTAEPKDTDIIYNYTDLEGFYLYSKIRTHGVKGHKFRVATHKNGEWKKGKPDGAHGVYIPQGIEALKQSDTVCICEGEKDADTLVKYGLVGFSYGSSSDWRSEFAPLCDFKDVLIFRDNDVVGERVANQIRDDLEGRAKSVLIINPCPDIAGGDISDYAERGGNVYKLIADAQAGTYRTNDIDVILCDLFTDEKFKNLTGQQQIDLLVMRYVVPTMGERDNKLSDREFYFNRAWLQNMGLYAKSNTKARTKDINALIDAGYVKKTYDGRQKQRENRYTLCKSTQGV